MALTNDEKAQIRSYLGYPAINRSSDVALEGAMSAVEQDPSSEKIVRSLLVDLAEIDTTLKAARGRLKVSKVETITLAGPAEVKALNREGERLTARLGRVFDVKPLGASWGRPMGGFVRRT